MSRDEDGSALEGRLARVTEAIAPDRPGEVVLEARGDPEWWPAHADRSIPRHAPVVIVAVREDDRLEVAPFDGGSATG